MISKIFEKLLTRSVYMNKLMDDEIKTYESGNKTIVKLIDGTEITMYQMLNAQNKTGFMIRTDESTIYGENIKDSTVYMDVLTSSVNAQIKQLKLNTEKFTFVMNVHPKVKESVMLANLSAGVIG